MNFKLNQADVAKNAVKKAQDISGTVRLVTRPHKRKDRSSDVNNEHTATKSSEDLLTEEQINHINGVIQVGF